MQRPKKMSTLTGRFGTLFGAVPTVLGRLFNAEPFKRSEAALALPASRAKVEPIAGSPFPTMGPTLGTEPKILGRFAPGSGDFPVRARRSARSRLSFNAKPGRLAVRADKPPGSGIEPARPLKVLRRMSLLGALPRNPANTGSDKPFGVPNLEPRRPESKLCAGFVTTEGRLPAKLSDGRLMLPPIGRPLRLLKERPLKGKAFAMELKSGSCLRMNLILGRAGGAGKLVFAGADEGREGTLLATALGTAGAGIGTSEMAGTAASGVSRTPDKYWKKLPKICEARPSNAAGLNSAWTSPTSGTGGAAGNGGVPGKGGTDGALGRSLAGVKAAVIRFTPAPNMLPKAWFNAGPSPTTFGNGIDGTSTAGAAGMLLAKPAAVPWICDGTPPIDPRASSTPLGTCGVEGMPLGS